MMKGFISPVSKSCQDLDHFIRERTGGNDAILGAL
jgi:hypothetical protein